MCTEAGTLVSLLRYTSNFSIALPYKERITGTLIQYTNSVNKDWHLTALGTAASGARNTEVRQTQALCSAN